MEIWDQLERLKSATRSDMMPPTQEPALRHFSLDTIDRLMDHAFYKGVERGYSEARGSFADERDELRELVVQDATTNLLTWLLPLHAELEDALVAPVSLEPDPERPADEWADDRADRLQRVLDELRRALPRLAGVAQQSALVPEDRFDGQVSLWREVHPSDPEPVRDVEMMPAAALTNAQLGAVITNDVGAFEHAGRVWVSEALAELRDRAARHPHGPDSAHGILKALGLGEGPA